MKKPVEKPTKEEHGFEVLEMTLFNLRVCSPLGADEIETAVNKHFPSGTSLGWVLVREGKGPKPVACADNPAHTHFLLIYGYSK